MRKTFFYHIKRLILSFKLTQDVPTYWVHKLVDNENLFVMNIGANNGKTGDFLYELIHLNYNWKVLFVEPVPYLFKELKRNFKNQADRFYFENTAINNGESQFFYTVKEEILKDDNFPDWSIQLSSFNKNNIIKHLGKEGEKYIEEILIDGVNLKGILRKHETEPDIIQVDTEGYDWKILSQLDLKNFTPSIILFEIRHLSKVEISEALARLSQYYKMFKFDEDLLCVKTKLLNSNKLSKKDKEKLFVFEFKQL